MTNILLDAVWKGNIPLCNIFSTSLGKIKWIIRNNSIKMKEASKICPGILIIFLRTLLVFQKFFQTHWVFGLQKHADYAWMKSEQTAVDLPAASQGCPRRLSHGRVQISPVTRPHCAAVTVGLRGPIRTFVQVPSQPCSPSAVGQAPCHLLPEAAARAWPLGPCSLHVRVVTAKSVTSFYFSVCLPALHLLINR